jgi:hypothetical protein
VPVGVRIVVSDSGLPYPRRPLKRAVNAGSVEMPYQGKPVGAIWLLLGADGVSLRRGDCDLDRGALERIQATGYPDAEDVAQILLEAPDPEWVADFFEQQAGGD